MLKHPHPSKAPFAICQSKSFLGTAALILRWTVGITFCRVPIQIPRRFFAQKQETQFSEEMLQTLWFYDATNQQNKKTSNHYLKKKIRF